MSSCVKHFYCSLGEIPFKSFFSPLKSECEVCKLTSALPSKAFSNTALTRFFFYVFLFLFLLLIVILKYHVRENSWNSGYSHWFPPCLTIKKNSSWQILNPTFTSDQMRACVIVLFINCPMSFKYSASSPAIFLLNKV